jgi:hypothetical protein
VQPLQRLLPLLTTSSTPQSNGDGVGDGNGSDGYGGAPLQRLSPSHTSLTPQSNGDGVGDGDGSNGYSNKGDG